MVDASRSDILDAFDDYSAELRKTDNFLLYYAGHGWLDEDQEEGFYFPSMPTGGLRGYQRTIADTEGLPGEACDGCRAIPAP